jgi:iron complex outermembrane recepter protein
MDSFGRLNASVGYRFSDIGYMKQPQIKLDLFNVTNAHQLTGIYSSTNNAQAFKDSAGNTISGSAPTYYLGQSFSALVTFRSGF